MIPANIMLSHAGIGQVEWLYTCPLPEIGVNYTQKSALLEFQGLDTLCDIYVNQRLLKSVDNMFQTHVMRIPKDVIKSSNNVLLLHFKSAAKLAKELEAKMGRVRAGSTNLGDPSRVYVRKAQYGWRCV
jgi:beta-mannosidase